MMEKATLEQVLKEIDSLLELDMLPLHLAVSVARIQLLFAERRGISEQDYNDLREAAAYVENRLAELPPSDPTEAASTSLETDMPRHSGLIKPPGTVALRLLQFVFSKKTFEAVFAQAITDMREEHAEALFEDKPIKARYIVIRDHLNLTLTVLVYWKVNVLKKLVGMWKMIP